MTTENQFLRAAIFYAERGYPVFPCVPGGKTPLVGRGFYDATTDTDQIERWWTQHPTANIAIHTEGLIVLDVDGEDNDWMRNQHSLVLQMSTGAIATTPRGGHHRWFRAIPGRHWGCTTGKIAKNVDTRGSGGYALVPPSRTSDGAYQWCMGSELECKPEDLPIPPDWLAEIFDRIEGGSVLDMTGGEIGGEIIEGQRNSALARFAGVMRRYGMTRNEIAAAIQEVNAGRCIPPLPKGEVDRIARSISRYDPDQASMAAAEGHYDHDRRPETLDPGPFPVELLDKIPGALGIYSAFAQETAFRPQPVLALGAAISLVGAVTGHKVQDEFGTRTNVYCLGVAPSGAGKERARQVTKEVLAEAGADALIGPEGFASHAGLVAAVAAQPCVLFQVDEIGRILRSLCGFQQPPHLVHIVTNLMKLFTSSNSYFKSDAYADTDRNTVIHQPHACLWGTTVPESFFESLTKESVTDGFISRLLVFEAPEELPPKQKPKRVATPTALLDWARSWLEFRPGGNLNTQHPKPEIWGSDADAESIFEQFDEEADERLRDKDDNFRSIWTRATEKARKLALIHACSRGPKIGRIDADAATWGVALADYLTRRIVFLASRWISETLHERKVNLILRVIAEVPEGVTATYLARKLRSMPSKERNAVLEDLLLSGEIEKIIVPATKKPKTLYRIAGNNSFNSQVPIQFFPARILRAGVRLNGN